MQRDPASTRASRSRPLARNGLSATFRLSRLHELHLKPELSPPLFVRVDPLRNKHFRIIHAVSASRTGWLDLDLGDIVTRHSPNLSNGIADLRYARTRDVHTFAGCQQLVPADAMEELNPVEAWTFQLAYAVTGERLQEAFGADLELIQDEIYVDLVKRAFAQHVFEEDMVATYARKRQELSKMAAEVEQMAPRAAVDATNRAQQPARSKLSGRTNSDASTPQPAQYLAPSVPTIVSGLRAPPPTATQASEDIPIALSNGPGHGSDSRSTGSSSTNGNVLSILDGASDRLQQKVQKQSTGSNLPPTQRRAPPCLPQKTSHTSKAPAPAPLIPTRDALRSLPASLHKPEEHQSPGADELPPTPRNYLGREILFWAAAQTVEIEGDTQTQDRNPILYPGPPGVRDDERVGGLKALLGRLKIW